MASRIRIFGVRGPSGEKQAARLYLPTGQTLPTNLSLVSPAWTFVSGGTWVDLPLAEVGTSGQYGCDISTVGNLPDSVSLPYEYVVVAVAGGTDLTNQAATTAAITTALQTPSSSRRSRQLYDQMGGPFIFSGAWIGGIVGLNMSQRTPANHTVGGQLDAAGTGGGGGGGNTIDITITENAVQVTP